MKILGQSTIFYCVSAFGFINTPHCLMLVNIKEFDILSCQHFRESLPLILRSRRILDLV